MIVLSWGTAAVSVRVSRVASVAVGAGGVIAIGACVAVGRGRVAKAAVVGDAIAAVCAARVATLAVGVVAAGCMRCADVCCVLLTMGGMAVGCCVNVGT
jgi:hypothetical protein